MSGPFQVGDVGDKALLAELARVKALFQARTVATILGAQADGIRIVDGQIVERLEFIPVAGLSGVGG